MYSSVIADKRFTIQMDVLRQQFPNCSDALMSDGMKAQLDALWEPHPTDWKKGGLRRPLTVDEHIAIAVEVARCKASVRHWLANYATITDKDAKSHTLSPLLDSQEVALDYLAKTEEAIYRGERKDGLLFAILKCRQVGISTLWELLTLHRTSFYGNLYALIAADVEAQSANLFDMTERALRALPWWMRPKITNHVKDQELTFGDIDSRIRVTFANTTRGGKQLGFEKGQMGRGSTVHLFHGSEMSTWYNAGQVDDALEPAIPRSASTLAALESTARGRGWWYRTWVARRNQESRWIPLFLGWYLEARYRAVPPIGWVPQEETVRHALHVERFAEPWYGRKIELDREQMYFWESMFLTAKKDHKLFKFLAEYAADDESCFRVRDDGFFSGETLLALRQEARAPIGLMQLT